MDICEEEKVIKVRNQLSFLSRIFEISSDTEGDPILEGEELIGLSDLLKSLEYDLSNLIAGNEDSIEKALSEAQEAIEN